MRARVVSVRLPEELIEEVERLVKEGGSGAGARWSGRPSEASCTRGGPS